MRLPERRPVEIPSTWSHQLFAARDGETALSLTYRLGRFVPPGLLERLMAACGGLGKHRYFWRTGALVMAGLNGGREGRLLLDVDESEMPAVEGGTGVAADDDDDDAEGGLEHSLRLEVFG